MSRREVAGNMGDWGPLGHMPRKRETACLGRRYQRSGRAAVVMVAEQEAAREEVRYRIEVGEYQMVQQPCICVHASSRGADDLVLSKTDRFGLPLRTVLCRHCGLARSDPRLGKSSMAHFYEHFYTRLYAGIVSGDERLFQAVVQSGVKRFEYVKSRTAKPPSRVLEIGCGSGGNLYPWHQHGVTCVGYDYGSEFLEFGRKVVGLDLRFGGLDHALSTGEQYDVIILSHVVEHLADPLGDLHLCKGLLSSSGVVYVEVPDIFRWGVTVRKLDPLAFIHIAHCWYFVLPTLSMIMGMAGFEPISGDEFVHSLWQVASSDAPAVRTDGRLYEKVLAHLQRCEMERKLVWPYLWSVSFGRYRVGQLARRLGVYPLLTGLRDLLKSG